MRRTGEWLLPDKEKEAYIANLTAEIPSLRAKLGISQGDLARVIGISRQTLSAIERSERAMSWDTYLSMLFFFDNNNLTHQTIRNSNIFPESLVRRFNKGSVVEGGSEIVFDKSIVDIFEKLDDRAMDTLKTTLLVEYARCSEEPIEAVVKAFNELKLEKPQRVEIPKRGRKKKN